MIVQLKKNVSNVTFKNISDEWTSIDLDTLNLFEKFILMNLINDYKISVGNCNSQCIHTRQSVIGYLK